VSALAAGVLVLYLAVVAGFVIGLYLSKHH